MAETKLSNGGNHSEGTISGSGSRDSTPQDDSLVASLSDKLCVTLRLTIPNPKASSCCIHGRGRRRRSRPARRPRITDLCFCRDRSGFTSCNPDAPAPVSRTRETRRKDGKVILPCPGCEEPRVPPLPNECFTFCKKHVNDFNSCRVHPKPKKCAQKCVKK